MTDQTLADGWLRTGDVAAVNEDGYFFFVDRAKDMIKRAGENVSCSEVEAVINSHPEVFESAVIGIPDDIRDEALHAFVVRKPASRVGKDEVLAYCREKVSKFKVPDSVESIDDLPPTSVGKIRKHMLRHEESPRRSPGDGFRPT